MTVDHPAWKCVCGQHPALLTFLMVCGGAQPTLVFPWPAHAVNAEAARVPSACTLEQMSN